MGINQPLNPLHPPPPPTPNSHVPKEVFGSFEVRQRISFKILLFVLKAIHGFAPTYLRELVSIKRSGNYNLRSSSDGLLLATST